MTRDELLTAKRNALLVAILDYAVEIGDGVAAAQVEDGSTLAFSREDVRDVRQDAREWLALTDRLASGDVPPDDVPSRREAAARLLGVVEENWPLALALVDTAFDEDFRPRPPL